MTKALREEAEEIKKELEALTQEEEKVVEDTAEAPAEAEETAEPEEEEEPTEAEEKPKEEELDASGYRRLRLEKEAERRRADDLERQIAELKAQKPQEPEQEEVEAPQTDYELEQIKLEKRYEAAERAVVAMEQDFKQSAPEDFDDVSLQYKATIYRGLQADNPDYGHDQLLEATRRKLLEIAANHKAKGYNPIEKMYLDGKRMGFKSIPKQEESVQEELKPDLNKIAANKRRNAGTAGAKGAGERAQMTPAALADLPASEYAKIPLAERMRIMKSLPIE